MTECHQIPQSLRLRLSALFWRYWLSNSEFRTLGTLQQPFCKARSLTRDVFVVPPFDFVGSHVVWRLKTI
jgi:hypothetical protein